MKYNLPTNPDGDFYSIPEVNALLDTKVSIEPQTLTTSEKAQAKNNLDIPLNILESQLQSKNNLAENTDLNNVKTGGMYRLWGKYTNAWSTSNVYSMMLVFICGTSAPVFQICFSATLTYLKVRSFINDSWGDWKDIAFVTE